MTSHRIEIIHDGRYLAVVCTQCGTEFGMVIKPAYERATRWVRDSSSPLNSSGYREIDTTVESALHRSAYMAAVALLDSLASSLMYIKCDRQET